MNKIVWQGIFPALITPFTADDKPDLRLFEKSLEAQLSAGVHGIVLGGSLGEASTLQENEKEILVRTAVKKINKRVPIIINIAESSTKEAVRQTQLAKDWEADGLMIL